MQHATLTVFQLKEYFVNVLSHIFQHNALSCLKWLIEDSQKRGKIYSDKYTPRSANEYVDFTPEKCHGKILLEMSINRI